jgi:HD-GYP domain-containing protein (c-di-GMP phosphodiesterase class II)
MANLYNDPYNDELLTNQFQNSKNLGILLYNNRDIQKNIYHNLSKQKYHYTHKQPLLTSIMLLSYLQNLNLFSEAEIQTLFLTSYFKDIGMSFIPRDKFGLAVLSEFDKKLFADHAENSMKILEGRVPMNQTQLNIIKNHHYLNYKIQSMARGEDVIPDEEYLSGIESSLLASIDILVAMTTERPYRKAMTSFKALELLKKVLSDEYPQEFKTLVFFLKNFFSK